MALEDIQYPDGERQFIVELPPQNHSGTVNDIVAETRSKQALIHELRLLLTLINARRKVR